MEISSLQILVVEDDQINSLLIRKVLERWNINGSFARNGLEALGLVEKQNYDLILMDLHMPILDGFETTKTIRAMQNPSKSNAVIIALSASETTDFKHKIEDFGFDEYMNKPVEPSLLKQRLEQILRNKALV